MILPVLLSVVDLVWHSPKLRTNLARRQARKATREIRERRIPAPRACRAAATARRIQQARLPVSRGGILITTRAAG
ncbi:hypothetical protein JOF53_004037 [Crossiella equi]|uniref:Uncharacterized protein n=1 Tax=Crossiella equi TaxID=130796 RepID=A0ABS5AHK7_9PSEU|nr:hypothetical protein [Crossiella equi]MBP2475165.1 hypothetical protein [Crossiella equi]